MNSAHSQKVFHLF